MSTDQLVLVTGASGYVASHVVQQLLVAGYRVRGTVRSFKIEEKVAPLRELVPDAKHPLELVEADLTKDEGWDQACSGCWAVIHVASYLASLMRMADEETYIQTTVNGAQRVMKAAAAAGVKKMVLTSSFQTITGDPSPWVEGKTYTEEDWTDIDYPNLEFYPKSKTMAERAAWAFVENMPEESKIELSTIQPTFVWGPPLLKCQAYTPSMESMINILTNKYPGHPSISVPFCDVRDVAEAHVKCLTTPAAAGKRFIIYSRCEWLATTAKILDEELKPQGYALYTNTIPYFVLWFFSFFKRKLTASNFLQKLDLQISISNRNMVEVLGIQPTDLRKTVLDMAYSIIELGMVPKTSNYRGPTSH
uniref:NADPH-dependent aldehyde reductase ARI1-like n=1 Tax=Hirondellea gigas TaxID=1518452 RepID=A0A2P2I048_9CRUS